MFNQKQTIYERFVRWNHKNCKEVKTWERGIIINGIYFIGGMISIARNKTNFYDMFGIAMNSMYIKKISQEMNCDYTKYIV